MTFKKYLILAIVLLAVAMPIDAQERPLSFDGVELGVSLKTCMSQFKKKGFRVHRKTKENDSFYGDVSKVFMTGKYDDEPTAIVISASHRTSTVYEIEVLLREFIDYEEAAKKLDGIIQREVSRFQSMIYFDEPSGIGMTAAMVDMPSGKNHITKTLMNKDWSAYGRVCRSKNDVDNKHSYGSIGFAIYQSMLQREYLVMLRYYDLSIGKAAMAESNQKQ